MANFYRPQLPFDTSLILLIPTYEKISGVRKKIYPELENGILFFASFKTYGGTDTTSNGVLSVEATADIETWFMPEIKSDCIIAFPDTNVRYEILGEPENISMRNQFLKFKVRRIKGGA